MAQRSGKPRAAPDCPDEAQLRRWPPPGRWAGGLLWPGLLLPGRWTGGLWTGGLWTGRWTKPGWRQPCHPAAPPQPNPRRHAKPHWYQPGPRQAELYQQYLRPPQMNCACSTGELSASAARGANAPTSIAASAGRASWATIPAAAARDKTSLRNMRCILRTIRFWTRCLNAG